VSADTVPFPLEGQSKEIGRYAKTVFMNAKPSSWIETELPADSDFGFDYQVQVKVEDQVKYTFRVQLKGTTRPKWIAGGETLSFALDTSTLNMYENTADRTLLVVCVVPEELPRPYIGTTYFVWVSDALPTDFEERRASGGQQASYSIHIPAANKLTYETDIVPYLRSHVAQFRSAVSISELLSEALDGRATMVEPIQALESALAARPRLVTALVEQSDIWPAPPKGSAVGDLLEVAECMRHGSWDRATDLHARIDATALTDEERAEYLFLEGRLFNRKGLFQDAEQKFERAHQILPVRDVYLVAAIEAHLAAQSSPEPTAIRELIGRLKDRDLPAASSLRARLLAACGEDAEAERLLLSLSSADGAVPLAVLFFNRSRFDDAIRTCTDALERNDLKPRDRALLLVLRARCRWHLAIGLISEEDELPLFGLPGTDISAWKLMWNDISTALPVLRELNWPIDGDLFADVVVSVALTTGSGKELYPFLASAAESLPWCASVQRAHETLCMALARFDEALFANSRLDASPANVARRVALLHQAGDLQGCAAAVDANLAEILASGRVAPVSVGMGAIAAAKCGNPLLANKLLGELLANPAWAEHAAFFRLGIESQRRGNDVAMWAESLKKLRHDYPDSAFIAHNLLAYLDANSSEDAQTVLDVIDFLRTSQEVSYDDTERCVRACLTLKHWDKALREVDGAIARFGSATRLVAMRAIALDYSGKTAAALTQFQEGILASDAAVELLHAYLGICLRLSMFDAARSAVSSLLMRSRNSADIVELKRLLLMIATVSNTTHEECVALLRDFSATVDRNDAEQEAKYLSIFAHAQYIRGVQLPEELVMEFHVRSNAYSANFPDSRKFTVINTPQDAGPDELLKSLEPILGDWRVKGQEYLRREREIKEGKLPIPYITRPGYGLHYVSDPLTLWEASKAVPADMRQFQMTMRLAHTAERPLSDFSRPPAVDLTALMVLDSLGLLDVLFQVWPTIVIGQLTVAYLSQLSNSPLDSARGHKLAKHILDFIRRNLEHIEQPLVELPSRPGSTLQAMHLVQEAEALNRMGHPLLADDLIVRLWCQETTGAENSFCSLDVLRWAQEGGKLHLDTVCHAYARLCDWNVGISVPLNVFLAPLADESLSSGSLHEVAEKLRRNELFNTLSRAVWWPDKDYVEMLNHIGAVLLGLLHGGSASDELIAAVWSAWLSKVQFSHNTAGQRENRAASVCFVARRVEGAALRRIWSAFKFTVELEHGGRMEKRNEREAVEVAALFASKLVLEESDAESREVARRLQDCLTPGTEEAQWFSDGLLQSIEGLSRSDRQHVTATLEAVRQASR